MKVLYWKSMFDLDTFSVISGPHEPRPFINTIARVYLVFR